MAKQTCAECHFLTAYIPRFDPRRHAEQTPGQRQELMNGIVGKNRHPACYFGVWNSAKKALTTSLPELITQVERKDFCFFWPYRPGMLFEAAEILQKREVERAESAKDRRHTIWGLWIAAVALAVNAFLEILDRL